MTGSIFFRMYLALALEVYNRLFINTFGFMVVDKIKKHMLGLAQPNNSPLPSVLTLPFGFGENCRLWWVFFYCIYTYMCSLL